jgi:hypothetical protein
MEQDSSGIQAGQLELRTLFLARVEIFFFFTESRTGSGAHTSLLSYEYWGLFPQEKKQSSCEGDTHLQLALRLRIQ